MQQNSTDITQLLELFQQNYGGTDFGGLPGGDSGGSIFGEKGFGFNSGTANVAGNILGGITDLAGLYFGNKKLKLAKDQLATNTAFGNRNIANQAKVINNTLEARYRAALAAQGVNPETGGTGSGGTQRESVDSYLARSKVDGSAVGGG